MIRIGGLNSSLRRLSSREAAVPLPASNRTMKTARPMEASAQVHANPGGAATLFFQGRGAVLFEVIR